MKRLKKKWIWVFIVMLLIIVIGGLIWFFSKQDKQILNTGELNERFKEYVAVQNKTSSNWNVLSENNNTKPIAGESLITVDDCFSFTLSAGIRNKDIEKECIIKIATSNPYGTIFAYTKKESYTSTDEISDVRMRKLSPEIYKEEIKIINGKRFAMYQNNQNPIYGSETVVFYVGNGFTFTVSMLYGGWSGELEKILNTILSSVIFYYK